MTTSDTTTLSPRPTRLGDAPSFVARSVFSDAQNARTCEPIMATNYATTVSNWRSSTINETHHASILETTAETIEVVLLLAVSLVHENDSRAGPFAVEGLNHIEGILALIEFARRPSLMLGDNVVKTYASRVDGCVDVLQNDGNLSGGVYGDGKKGFSRFRSGVLNQ